MKYAIATLGCKVNQFETQAMENMLHERGFESTSSGDADVVIVNTCAVTAESGRKSRQTIRRMQNDNPGAVTAVCGCFSQISPEEVENLSAEVVFGSGRRGEFIEAVVKTVTERQKVKEIDEPFRRQSFETLPAGAMDGRTRAYMKIQDGCENFCTYCVIPFARGRVLSMPVREAAKQAELLSSQGFKEIVVTGIEIASYGKDLKDGSTLADVVCAVAQAAKGARIHLGSLEPRCITRELCEKLRQQGNICPHFHLSLQSGCDETLAAMRRKYDTIRFYDSVRLLREYFPNCGITADLITGFPGETEQNHADTLKFIEKCAFSAMHVFPYSRRPGTKADTMPNQLTKAVKEARAHEAQALADAMQQRFLQEQIGKTLTVIFENQGADGKWNGHSENYCLVCADGENLHGTEKQVKIIGAAGKNLVGEVL